MLGDRSQCSATVRDLRRIDFAFVRSVSKGVLGANAANVIKGALLFLTVAEISAEDSIFQCLESSHATSSDLTAWASAGLDARGVRTISDSF